VAYADSSETARQTLLPSPINLELVGVCLFGAYASWVSSIELLLISCELPRTPSLPQLAYPCREWVPYPHDWEVRCPSE
jgi:hypothetical protein